jgi:Family of unknown function (DUF6632)
MVRERALKVVLVVVGLLFLGAMYPIVMNLRAKNHAAAGDAMLFSLYFTLGIFLLLAVRDPSAHRSLIAFAAWSSFAHAAVMTAQAFEFPGDRGLVGGSVAFAVIGVVLIALSPRRRAVERTAASPALMPR